MHLKVNFTTKCDIFRGYNLCLYNVRYFVHFQQMYDLFLLSMTFEVNCQSIEWYTFIILCIFRHMQWRYVKKTNIINIFCNSKAINE